MEENEIPKYIEMIEHIRSCIGIFPEKGSFLCLRECIENHLNSAEKAIEWKLGEIALEKLKKKK